MPARPPRESAMIMAHFNASFPVPIRAGTSSSCSACRPSQRGVGNTKVPAALKPQPALDPNPVLSCNSPLCCGHRCFSSRSNRCAHALLRRPPGQGVRVRLGSELGPWRWHIHSPPPGPLAGAADLFWGSCCAAMLGVCPPTRYYEKTTGLTWLWMIQFSSVGPLFCARVLS